MYFFLQLTVISFFTTVSTHEFTLISREESFVRLHSHIWKPTGKLHFNIQTNGEDGSILSITNHDGNLMKLESANGVLSFSLDGEKLPLSAFTDDVKLNANVWNHVQLEQTRNILKLGVNHINADISLIKRRPWVIDNWKDVTIGLPANEKKSMVARHSIVGCVHLQVHNRTNKYAAATHAILEKCVDACAIQTCDNGGSCINQYNSIACDCRGTGYEGNICDTEAEAVAFDTTNFMKMKMKNAFDRHDEISIRFKTNVQNGILIATTATDDLLLVELYNSSILLAVRMSTGIFRMNTGKNLHDGQWHHFKISRNFHDVEMKLDNDISVHADVRDVNNYVNLNTNDNFLHYGGVQKPDKVYHSMSRINFQGCLQQVYFGRNDVIRNTLKAHDSTYSKEGELKRCNELP